MKRRKAIIIVLLALVIISVMAYMLWPYFYAINHYCVQIDNEEYFFWPSVICHSEQEFKKVPIGTTYAEIEDRFGIKNGWYNHTGAAGSYFYIVAPHRYVIIAVHASDEWIDYVKELPNEEQRRREKELFGKLQLTSMYCATDDEILWERIEHLEGFSYFYGYD